MKHERTLKKQGIWSPGAPFFSKGRRLEDWRKVCAIVDVLRHRR
jgi:hypothetical protein